MKDNQLHENFNYSEAGESLRALLDDILNHPKKHSHKYTGPEILSSSILASSANISESFKKEDLDYHKERGRDKLNVFINKVFQLGFSVGTEKTKNDLAPLINMMTKSLKDESDKEQKSKRT